jgi:hypothetical protein
MKAQRRRYSSTLSLISTLDGGEWLTPCPVRFTPWKERRYPLYKRLGRPQGRSRRVRKISPAPEFDPWILQPVASHYRLSYPGSHTFRRLSLCNFLHYLVASCTLGPHIPLSTLFPSTLNLCSPSVREQVPTVHHA